MHEHDSVLSSMTMGAGLQCEKLVIFLGSKAPQFHGSTECQASNLKLSNSSIAQNRYGLPWHGSEEELAWAVPLSHTREQLPTYCMVWTRMGRGDKDGKSREGASSNDARSLESFMQVVPTLVTMHVLKTTSAHGFGDVALLARLLYTQHACNVAVVAWADIT